MTKILNATILGIILCFFSFHLLSGQEATDEEERFVDSDGFELCSIISLIAENKKYDGRKVMIQGFLQYEHDGTALYLGRDALNYRLTMNGIKLKFGAGTDTQLLKKLSGKCVSVRGTFSTENVNSFGFWPGFLECANENAVVATINPK